MAKTIAKRRASSKSAKKRRTKEKVISMEEVESSIEKMALNDFTETTKQQLKKLGDKIHEATEKGVHVVKEIAADVQRFAKDKTELTRIKIELHNLKAEREKLYKLMGEQLRNLYKSKQLTNIKKRFRADFERLEELEEAIDAHEKHAGKLS